MKEKITETACKNVYEDVKRDAVTVLTTAPNCGVRMDGAG